MIGTNLTMLGGVQPYVVLFALCCVWLPSGFKVVGGLFVVSAASPNLATDLVVLFARTWWW